MKTTIERTGGILATALLLCLTLWCAPAAAQQGDAAEMNRQNEEGFQEFQAGRYEEAARRFRAAYDAFPDPNLRKNEAVAWFKAGRCPEAIPAANAFLIAPETSEADRLEARSILANCRVEMARAAFATGNLDLAESLLDEAESMQPDQYALDQIGIARVELAERRSSTGPAPTRKGSAIGWIMVASGAAVIGGTLAYWLLTIPDRHDSKNLSPMDPRYDTATSRARTSRWLAPVGLIGGGVLAGIGIYVVVTGGGGGGHGKSTTAGLTYRW